MPSFLSKVFPGRKKEDHGTHPSPTSPTSPTNQAQTRGRLPSLLGGKYEAVSVHSSSAPPSPIQPKELGKVNEKEKDKEKDKEKEKEKEKDGGHGGFGGIFRVRSRPMSPVRGRAVSPIREQPQSPSLLDLPGLTDVEVQRSLGTLFETDPVAETTLDESAIAGRRLTPLETLVLVKACGEYINEHGSETLGLMHPHWYSSDPAVQRKLASLFLLSLTPTPASTTTVSPSGAFENELNYTRDPHDVAAVLRWGLRHFEPSTPASTGSPSTTVHSFGLSRDWYTIFHDNERSSGYPLRAFTEKLVPLLPEEHTSLLNAILDVTSCLARHAEANGISGSKFAKFVGFWVLAVPRIEPNDDWEKFYTRWERNGRMMEHLFLARIRDESAVAPLPRRLTELVQNYPYSSSPHTDDGILTRPRFSTRVHPALLVRVDTPIANKDGPRSTLHGLALVKRALEASSETEADTSTESQDGAVGVWTRIKSLAVVPPTEEEPDPEPALQLVIADDSITLLTLASGSTTSIKPSTPAAPSVPVVRVRVPPQHKASASIDTTGTRTNGHSQSSSSATSPSSAWSPISWADFSQAGFGSTPLESTLASTLWDTDLEKTQPPSPHPGLVRRLSSKAGGAKTPRSRSVSRRNSRRARVSESDGTPLERETEEEPKKERKQVQERVKGLKLVEVDEAFVDFWSDAVTDPIASEWPPFALAQLKSVEGIEHDGKRVEWLVVEQTFSEPPPPPPPAPPVPTPAPTPAVKQDEAVPRAPKLGSPRLSVSSVTKRFTFFGRDSQAGKHKDEKDLGKKRQTGMKVGEMGEIVREEEEPSLGGQAAVKDSLDIPKATEVAKVEDKDEVTKSAKEPENIPLPPDTASQAESNTSEVKSKFVEHAETPSPAAVDAATKTPETDHDAEVAAAGVAAAGVVAVAAAVADSAIVTVDGIDNEEE
ncbi:hypothetical protein PUNSTDRAFT_91263, partial [Punctularia strigosozonata HHB-11173 SS5]|uniref:uncharacterized protein n=1 Tax=Punctularia strigosozonata (strain HHB-11173) TaxID=741275 RepID=UPI000441782F